MSLSTITPYLMVFTLIVIGILCTDTSNLKNVVRAVNNTNPTVPKINFQRIISTTTTTTTTTTTPWPVLGQRDRRLQNSRPHNFNSNNPRLSRGRPNSASYQGQLDFIAKEAQSSSSLHNTQPKSIWNNQHQQSFANVNKLLSNPSINNRAQPQTSIAQLNPLLNNNRDQPNPTLNNGAQPNPTMNNKAQPNSQKPSSNQFNLHLNNKNSQPTLPKTSLGQQNNRGDQTLTAIQNMSPDQKEDDELREFSETLLAKDVNNAAKYVTINYQGKTTSRSQQDEAPQPLLSINQQAYNIPSIEKLMLLYNNYFLVASVNEHTTGQEKIEENNLLDVITSTPVMQHTRNFLISKGKLGKDPKEFKDLLRLIWFNMYSRGEGKIGSSGFEHVFLAEIKNNQATGLHNWVYFSEQEKKNQTNYLGFMKKIDLGNKGAILKYHFNFHGIDKPVGSMFIGTSPELEIALYSTCFILRADKICPLKLNGNKFIIRTFNYRYRGKNMIGSAFPDI